MKLRAALIDPKTNQVVRFYVLSKDGRPVYCAWRGQYRGPRAVDDLLDGDFDATVEQLRIERSEVRDELHKRVA